MKQWIKAVGAAGREARNLTYDEAVAAAHAIARGEATESQTAALLTALRIKGETVDEATAFIDVFRKYSMPYASFSDSLHCAGAYGNRQLFPVTIPVSLMMASVGFPQVLQGTESGFGPPGASLGKLLEGLGINTDLAARDFESVFATARIGYISTESMCPAMAVIRKVQGEVGLDTFMVHVERIINPLHSRQILIGVGPKTPMAPLVQLLPKAGMQKAVIVQGLEGSEDLSLGRTSTIRIATPYSDETAILEPATFGFSGDVLEPVAYDKQLELLNRIIAGDDAPELQSEREHVIFNAGLRLYWHEKVGSYEEGFQLARQLYARKEAAKMLKRWRELTAKFEREPKQAKNEAAGA